LIPAVVVGDLIAFEDKAYYCGGGCNTDKLIIVLYLIPVVAAVSLVVLPYLAARRPKLSLLFNPCPLVNNYYSNCNYFKGILWSLLLL